jgi:hypothetical protein
MRCLRRCLPAIALLGLPAMCGFAATTNPNPGAPMTAMIATAQQTVQQYDASKDPLLLRKAGELLEQVDLFAPPSAEQRADARRQTLEAWLSVLARIDAAHDPKFDPDDPPAARVAPPTPPGHRPYATGIDPQQIADPQVRADYERARAENEQKAERARRHWDLQAIDMEVSQGAKRFIKRFYTSSQADQSELRAAMTQAALGARRQQQLLSPTPSRP